MRVVAVVWLIGWALVGLPWRSVSLQPSLDRVRLAPFGDGRVASQALNVLAFVPWGIAAAGMGWAPARAVLSGAGISLLTEIAQLFSTRRYPTTSDVMLNTLGTAMGVAAVAATRRRRPK